MVSLDAYEAGALVEYEIDDRHIPAVPVTPCPVKGYRFTGSDCDDASTGDHIHKAPKRDLHIDRIFSDEDAQASSVVSGGVEIHLAC